MSAVEKGRLKRLRIGAVAGKNREKGKMDGLAEDACEWGWGEK